MCVNAKLQVMTYLCLEGSTLKEIAEKFERCYQEKLSDKDITQFRQLAERCGMKVKEEL
jgi:hypothetical protein